jgi:NAD(P)-dependent dehydrogenase (short-subunit alcohol dehydrogenase family)
MSTIHASELLRPGLLEGVSIVLASAPTGESGEGSSGSLASEVGGACAGLGARVLALPLDGETVGEDGGEPRLGQAVERSLADVSGDLQVLVIDGAGLFGHALDSAGSGTGSDSAREALRACLGASWSATHAFVNHILLPGGRGGRIVYLAPAPDAGEHADAALSGLENLARTLSIEWARHGITTVAVAPGAAMLGEVAALSAYLASPAGAYFSGCLLDLRGCELGYLQSLRFAVPRPSTTGGAATPAAPPASSPQPVIPPNSPPVMCKVCPCT